MSDRLVSSSFPDGSSPFSADAVAVVGAACRLPGGIRDLGTLWAALAEGRDLISDVPPDGRFDAARFHDPDPACPGKSYSFAGGYLDGLAEFDAEYFGISPREAKHMDPQQRLLLEMTAEAFDDAGIAAESLAGSDTAVFVGVSDTSYGVLQMLRYEDIDPHTMSGGSASITANRLSHFFDLRGPSVAVDTACSSSLVALHQACETLRAGRGRVALAGGVNVLLGPQPFIGFARAGMLSPRGRCAAFSSRADGYVRAEGGGVVLLKRLADALSDGDPVHAVIAGSGTNTAGHTPHLSVPSAEMQRELLLDVHARAGVEADDLVYFEAHGTGTPVGDPLECLAVGQAVARRRRRGALPIGSVKSNLGHAEPASGMAGLFKAMLVLRHGRIPATLHSEPANPAIDFRGLNLEPVGSSRPVARRGGFVGVNSFGFGGVNAHVLLAGTPPPAVPESRREGPLPVVVGARSRGALTRAVRDLGTFLTGGSADGAANAGAHKDTSAFYDQCWTLARRRTRHPYRLAVLADDARDAARRLSRLSLDGEGSPAYEARPGPVVFAFSGNGGQWSGMAAGLLASEPVFRTAVGEADAALAPRLGWSVADLLTAGGQGSARAARAMADTRYAQPALFAVQSGLLALLDAHGVRPRAVVGHSVGEVAAAFACGALDLPAAARVVAERSLAQASTAGCGRMAVAALSPEEAEKEIAPYAGLLEVGAVNSSRNVTISGDREALRELARDLVGRGVPFRELDLDHAFHSPAMDGIEEPLRRALAGLDSASPRLPMYSTVTTGPVRAGQLDAGYWWENVRRPVLFEQAVRHLADDLGPLGAIVEIGPRPILRGALTRIAAECDSGRFLVIPTIGRTIDDTEAVRRAVARLAAADAGVDWERWFPRPGRVVNLPAYPWQRERHWFGTPEHWIRTSGDGVLVHPLLGERAPVLEPAWHTRAEHTRCPWLADHRLGDDVVLPAAAYLEMALAAGRELFGAPAELDRVDISRLLPLPPPPSGVRLQTSLSDEDGVVRVASRASDTDSWRVHARGRCRRLAGTAPPPLDLARLRARTPLRLRGHEHYAAARRRGLTYGPAFRVLCEVWQGDGEVLASYAHDAPDDGYGPYVVHPVLLDGAFQAGIPLLPGVTDTYLPAAVGRVRVWRTPSRTGLVHVRERSRTGRETVCDIAVADEDGTITVELEACRLHCSALRDDLPQEYTTVLRAAHLPGQRVPPVAWPRPAAVLAAVRPEVDALLEDWDAERYARRSDALDRTVAHAAAAAFADILPEQREFTRESLVAAGVSRAYRPYVELLADTACRHGLLERTGELRWASVRPADFRGAVRDLVAEHPGHAATVVPHALGGLHLADVLRGRHEPPAPLSADAGQAPARRFPGSEPAWSLYHRIAAAVVGAVVRSVPGDRALRILEVGAGEGDMTVHLLHLLPPDRTEYVCSDATAAQVEAARTRFAAHDFVRYEVLDLDRDPVGQGLAAGSFDLVVAGHALRTARDVTACARSLARLLVPGGQLLALEAHDPGLLPLGEALAPGFWEAEDRALRSGSVLLPYDRWPTVLLGIGFDSAEEVPGPLPGRLSVVLARRAEGETENEEEKAAPSTDERAAWVLIAEDDSEPALLSCLAEGLAEGGGRARNVTARQVREQRSCLVDVASEEARVVYVLSEAADQATAGRPGDAVALAVRRAAVLREVARVCQDDERAVRSLCLVTHPTGALPAPERPACPPQAAVWGAARTLANELPRLAVRRVSLERFGRPENDAARLVRELRSDTGEDEVVLASGGRFVPRVVRAPEPVVSRAVHEGTGCSLAVTGIGLGYRLHWESNPRAPRAGAGEVLVDVRAAALNYRDVMVVTGLLPPVAEDGAPSERLLGLEFAGVVAETGPSVEHVAVGDRVFGIAPGSLATRVRVPAALVRPVPGQLSFAEAATVPVAFLTVQHGLERLARLRAGETLLVHGGAGGVGLAALQYARHIGATVVATAGSPAKRDLLRVLGADHVLDSRSLGFADHVRELTGGRGADVVLNSLGGEAMGRGMEALAQGGRFVELGKNDVYANHRTLLGPLAGNTALFVVDVAQLTSSRAVYATEALATVARRLELGTYLPLPHQVFPARGVDEAFRLMRHSRHTGKVVVSMDGTVPVRPAPAPVRTDPEGTYLVTGGLSGLGAATALWLAERGVRHLALTGRRGGSTPGAPELLSRLAALGATATAHAVDVTDPGAMHALVQAVDSGGHPLRGVIHAAMHLDDDRLTDLDDERIRAVLAPKLGGGLVLDALTRGRDRELCAYSSLNALLGSIKQFGYTAGNLFLEALARGRADAGEAARCVAWGAIADTGYAARHGLTEGLAKGGLRPVTAEEACSFLGRPRSRDAEAVGFGRCDWDRMVMFMPAVGAPRFARLVRAPAAGAHGGGETPLRAQLASARPEEALAAVEEAVAATTAYVLRMPVEHLDRARPLRNYGLDSLLNMELLTALRGRLQCELTVMDLLHSDGSVKGICAMLLPRLAAARE